MLQVITLLFILLLHQKLIKYPNFLRLLSGRILLKTLLITMNRMNIKQMVFAFKSKIFDKRLNVLNKREK